MSGRRRAAAGGQPILTALLLACSTLPDYARPTAEVRQASTFRAGDTVRYRALSRADFRAAEPPEQMAAYAKSFGAFTCANVVPRGMARARFDPADEPGVYLARLENAEFYAEMDRTCSWWNPEGTALPSEYLLQHEQIHFALTEIQARRLNAQMREVRLRTESPQRDAAALKRRYDELLEAAMTELVRTSTDFDEDTSGSYQPERQARWLERVESELARTGGHASSPAP